MKQLLLLCCIAFISACQTVSAVRSTATPGNAANSATITSSRTSIIQTPAFSAASTPAPLAFQTINPAGMPTRSASSSAQCPKENSILAFDVNSAETGSGPANPNDHFTEYVLDFLNAGGTIRSIKSAFERIYAPEADPFFVQDVTGDSVPEVIFPYGIWVDVFGCKDGNYVLMTSATYESDLAGVRIIDIADLNRDGLAEIVAYFNGCLGNRCPSVSVLEWDGQEFHDLVVNASMADGCNSLFVAPFDVRVQDIDNNGTLEIILHNNGDPQPDNDFPYRQETRTCMWNGQSFVIYRSTFDPPHYRFQAVQDGDRATLAGDYHAAFVFYERTINDKSLEWFTQERKWHDFWVYSSNHFRSFQEPSPTVSPSMAEDPREYPILAAYAYYRIMLLHLLRDDAANARSTLGVLKAKFPPDSYFVQAASILWEGYQRTTDIKYACSEVLKYALDHAVPKEYLGDWDHGVQSIEYSAESICPFR